MQTSTYLICGCYFADLHQLQQQTQIHQLKPDTHAPIFEKVHGFLATDSVLGKACFQDMADAVLKAHTSASTANDTINWLNYLEGTWAEVLKPTKTDGTRNWVHANFLQVYVHAFLFFYDNNAHSTTQLVSDGRTRHHRPLSEGGKENVSLRQAQYIAGMNASTLNRHLNEFRKDLACLNLACYSCRNSTGGRVKF